ncbi:hypothetical protein J7E99_28510 [Streptomyces sp. ISL-44]|uniref:hypothetical protein n=1 Tax=Streptomyces sp. ISL-44 TaxID=2819184 RepID=UPI001BEAA7FF|nr:hypothetical protein [Streptomyces sp. ISL-44]MBT2544536.1 hypothetical protein [Streptomyces sp. ISL-44]
MSENPPEGPVAVEPPPGMGPNDYEFWDDQTRTYYERQEDGSVVSRPYNEDENRQTDETQNRTALEITVTGLSLLLAGDISTNDSYLTLALDTEAEVKDQVDKLTAQSTSQAEMLSALTRLTLSRLDSLGIAIQ